MIVESLEAEARRKTVLERSADFTVDVITTDAEFAALQPHWDRIVAADPNAHPFLEFDWFRLWWDAFGRPADRRPHLLVVRDGSAVRAIAPLCEGPIDFWGVRVRGLRSMTNDHSNRFGLIIDASEHDASLRPAALERILGELLDARRRAPCVLLQELPLDHGLPDWLAAAAPRRSARLEQWHSFYSPFVPLEGGWNAVQRRLRQRFRAELRRREGKLAREAGALTLEQISGGDRLEQAIAEMFEIELAGWKGEAKTAMACNATTREFYTRLARTAAARGWLSLDFLVAGGRRVAFSFHLRYRDRLYLLKTSFRPEYATYAPGALLIRQVLERSCNEGLARFDFVGQRDAYKLNWTDQLQVHSWCYLFGRGAFPAALRWIKFGLAPGLKRVLARGHTKSAAGSPAATAAEKSAAVDATM